MLRSYISRNEQTAVRILFVSSTHPTPDPWHRNLSRAGERLCTRSPSAVNRLWSTTRKHSRLSGWRNEPSLGKCTGTGGTKSRLSAKVRGERATDNRTLKNNLLLPFLCNFIGAVVWIQIHTYVYIHHPNTRKPPIHSHFCFHSKLKQGWFCCNIQSITRRQ